MDLSPPTPLSVDHFRLFLDPTPFSFWSKETKLTFFFLKMRGGHPQSFFLLRRYAAEDRRLSVLSNLALYLVAPVERWAPSVCCACAGLALFFLTYTFLVGLSWVFFSDLLLVQHIYPGLLCYFFLYGVQWCRVQWPTHARNPFGHTPCWGPSGPATHLFRKGDAN